MDEGKLTGKAGRKKTKFVKQICFHLTASSITRFLRSLSHTKNVELGGKTGGGKRKDLAKQVQVHLN